MTVRRRTAPVALAALSALLLCGCASNRLDVPWLHLSLRLPGATASPSPDTAVAPPEVPTTPVPEVAPVMSVEDFVPVAEKFVEEHRGLRFKSPVKVTLLDDAAFVQRLLGKPGGSRTAQQALDIADKELVALHLISPGVDLGSSNRQLLGTAVSGFYDARSKDLVVRGVTATPYVREVIVHELTHALQDQWFGIDRPQLYKSNDERAVAFSAVVEGDAVRIQAAYHASLTPREQLEVEQEQLSQGGGSALASIPRVLLEFLGFPYAAGPPFLHALEKLGGQAEVDRAFTTPPVSTAQVLNADRYVKGEAPRPVAAPAAGGKVYDTSVLGEFGLALLLEHAVGMTPLQVGEVADLWGGDEYVAWDSGAQHCVRVGMLARNVSSQSALDDALQQYAHAVSGTYSAPSPSGPAVVTTCA